MSSRFHIVPVTAAHHELIRSTMSEKWGSHLSVSRGRMFDTTALPGFISIEDGRLIGLVTYHIEGNHCEIVTLNSKVPNRGLASFLIDRVIIVARSQGCERIWLITTNDNTHAMRFYQKRGFEWVAFHANAMDKSRQLKPEIPNLGNDDIPIKHEIEFELRLT